MTGNQLLDFLLKLPPELLQKEIFVGEGTSIFPSSVKNYELKGARIILNSTALNLYVSFDNKNKVWFVPDENGKPQILKLR